MTQAVGGDGGGGSGYPIPGFAGITGFVMRLFQPPLTLTDQRRLHFPQTPGGHSVALASPLARCSGGRRRTNGRDFRPLVLPALLLRGLGLVLCLLVLAGGARPAGAEVVLHRGNYAEPETLDPHMAVGLPEAQIFYDMYEGLAVRGPDGAAMPGLARSWTISPDGLTWTFTLRPDLRWSDGSAILASDVVFSLRRVVDPAATQARNANYLWPILNARPITQGALPPDALGVTAPDDRTVVIRLERPTGWLLKVLSYPMLGVLPERQMRAAGKDFFRPGTLVSSGPYRLAEYVPQGHVKLVRNPHHRDAARARIDTVYFHPTENQDTELKRYRAGELHTTYTLPAAQIDWARETMPDHLRINPQLGTYYYAPNLTRSPWKDDPRLVRALSMVIDRTLIVEKLTRGGELPAYAFVPPGVPDHTPQVPDWAAWPMERRVAEARALLVAAGYPQGQGLTVELLFNTRDQEKRVAVGLAGMWQQALGVRTVLTNQEWKVFLDSRRTKTFPGLARQGYIGAYDDPNVFLEWFRSDIGPENPAGYADPGFDALMDLSAAEPDPAARRALLEQAERMLLDDAAAIPLYTYAAKRLVSPRVKGWIDNPLDVHPTLYLSLE
ncbi:MAG: periplasmic oligopeptide-binding protein [Pseudomonadota bacterium]|jgi:oligopeptide transport system substrate-binding protein